jgi:DNA-binding response OmpR family regulator
MTRVIVVDDDRDTVEVFTEYLAIKGIDVVAKGYNGKEAVELYKEHTPDITLLDVMMPMYDGFYGLQNIRRINPNAKVIMVTADLTSDTEKKMHELQASAILYKPYEIDSVVETIDKVSKGKIQLEPPTNA